MRRLEKRILQLWIYLHHHDITLRGAEAKAGLGHHGTDDLVFSVIVAIRDSPIADSPGHLACTPLLQQSQAVPLKRLDLTFVVNSSASEQPVGKILVFRGL